MINLDELRESLALDRLIAESEGAIQIDCSSLAIDDDGLRAEIQLSIPTPEGCSPIVLAALKTTSLADVVRQILDAAKEKKREEGRCSES